MAATPEDGGNRIALLILADINVAERGLNVRVTHEVAQDGRGTRFAITVPTAGALGRAIVAIAAAHALWRDGNDRPGG